MKKTLLLIAFLSWNFPFFPQEKIVFDDLGSPFSLSTPPRRIISLAPNITEILFALSLGERIVGVTRYCDYPPQARKIEKIGGLVDLNLEIIKALEPDLIIAFRGNPLKTLNSLKKLRLPVFVLEMGKNLESLYETIGKIGLVTGQEKEAAALISSLKQKELEIQTKIQPVGNPIKVFLSLHGGSLWTCGKESFLNDLIRRAGGINVGEKVRKSWFIINREQFLQENPDVIIILARSEEDFQKAKEKMLAERSFLKIRAFQKETIYFLDENLVSRFGPRLLDALKHLASLLHPQAF